MSARRRRLVGGWICGLGVAAASAWPAPVRIFQESSADAFLAGELDGVAVADDGTLTLAPTAQRLAEIAEPYAFALARVPGGWAVGTGNDGRVVKVGDDGSSATLFDAEESEIFALWADPDGTLFVGSSPEGKLYRVSPGGQATTFFDPEETYIWAVARGTDGALWVATGAPGRLYRVDASGKAVKVWDGGATHVRSLLPLPDGDLLFGTAGDGRVLRWHRGAVRTLYDSDLTEVAALARGTDGSVWAAILASEASFVDLTPRSAASSSSDSDSSQAVVVVDASASAAGSRPSGSHQPRSQLVRLAGNGASEVVWSSAEETIFALLPDTGGVWMGTGLEGRLYRVSEDRARVVRDFEEKQIVALGWRDGSPVVLTTNGAALWCFSHQREAKGTYTSASLDAAQVARFGVFRWNGEQPEGSDVTASFRTGYSSEPDETWSEWSPPQKGREVALPADAHGRFVQYRLELTAGKTEGPRVVETELSYRQQNLRPTISTFEALDPGQILVPTGFNPTDQTFEPASPNRDGIFTTLRPTPAREDRMKKVWKQGWLTLRWDVTDPNDDDLRYRLEVRREDDDGEWLEIADDIDAGSWAFDATALPDGDYRFRLTASDAPDNPAGEALEAQRESAPVTVDHTPPELRRVERKGGKLEVAVYDALSPLRQAEISVDGAPWRPARPADGLLDGRSEVLMLEDVPKSARLVLLRVIDASFNVRTFDLGAESAR